MDWQGCAGRQLLEASVVQNTLPVSFNLWVIRLRLIVSSIEILVHGITYGFLRSLGWVLLIYCLAHSLEVVFSSLELYQPIMRSK